MVKVAIAGTGDLAQHIAHASISLGHEVLLLSRSEHPELSPLKVVTVNYSQASSLSLALAGVHTLVSTIPHSAPQLALINACLVARVQRIAPAEFEGVLELRPLVGEGNHRLDVLARLREEKHRLDSTVFTCGLFMERFGRDGREALLDYSAGTAWIPTGVPRACFIAAEDVGIFVAKALGLEKWPEQLKCCGERLKVLDAVAIAERVKGKKFDVRESGWEELQDLMVDAELEDAEEAARMDLLLAIQRGEFDFHEANLNVLFPEVKTMCFEEWLGRTWRRAEWEGRGDGGL